MESFQALTTRGLTAAATEEKHIFDAITDLGLPATVLAPGTQPSIITNPADNRAAAALRLRENQMKIAALQAESQSLAQTLNEPTITGNVFDLPSSHASSSLAMATAPETNALPIPIGLPATDSVKAAMDPMISLPTSHVSAANELTASMLPSIDNPAAITQNALELTSDALVANSLLDAIPDSATVDPSALGNAMPALATNTMPTTASAITANVSDSLTSSQRASLPEQTMQAERTVAEIEHHVQLSLKHAQQAEQLAVAKAQAQMVEQETLTQALVGPMTNDSIEKHTLAQDQVHQCATQELRARQQADHHAQKVQELDCKLNNQVSKMVEQVILCLLASIPAQAFPFSCITHLCNRSLLPIRNAKLFLSILHSVSWLSVVCFFGLLGVLSSGTPGCGAC
eukprot:TRINITY_DN11865_c1_g4_i3.p2 TRINITY_DN11865_c1_g4~~TRINITY_DN11865_c1_g4_i3.p2  ORF type:complete len:402 (+),score=81.71 TRINITY_DN11865_c1_g4_i3:214-1419(+)